MLTIEAIRGGWNIVQNGDPAAFIEANSFYLTGVKFKAGGEKQIHIHQLACTMKSYIIYPYPWSGDYNVEITAGPAPEWKLTAKNKDKSLENTTVLKVRENESGGIIYHVTQKLTALKEYDTSKVEETYAYVGDLSLIGQAYAHLGLDGKSSPYVEMTDPYPRHAVGPAMDFDGYWPGLYYPGQESNVADWRKKWQMFAFERSDGRYDEWVHSHHTASGIRYVGQNGIIAMLDEPSGNVVYRFLNKEGAYLQICHWGYDIHMILPRESLVFKPRESMEMVYEIYDPSPEETAHILANLVKTPLTEAELAELDKPAVVHGLHRFDISVAENDAKYFGWMKNGTGAAWDKTTGYDDSFSLKLENKPGGETSSWSAIIGQEMFMAPLYGGKQYRLSFYVKTENLDGCVKASVKFHDPVWPGIHSAPHPFVAYWTEEIKGAADWTKVELITPPAPKNVISSYIDIYLNGEGTAWVDNVLFEPV